jgi:hypothetical protein
VECRGKIVGGFSSTGSAEIAEITAKRHLVTKADESATK